MLEAGLVSSLPSAATVNGVQSALVQAGLRPTAAAFFKFWLIILLEGTASGALGLAISAACKSVDAANAIAPACEALLQTLAPVHIDICSPTCICMRIAAQASTGQLRFKVELL